MNLKNIKINKKIKKIIIEKNHTNTKYQNDILNKKTLSTTNKSTNSLFTIGSLNVRRLNDLVKLKCLSKYIQENKYLIFGISETKLNEKTVQSKKLDHITQSGISPTTLKLAHVSTSKITSSKIYTNYHILTTIFLLPSFNSN